MSLVQITRLCFHCVHLNPARGYRAPTAARDSRFTDQRYGVADTSRSSRDSRDYLRTGLVMVAGISNELTPETFLCGWYRKNKNKINHHKNDRRPDGIADVAESGKRDFRVSPARGMHSVIRIQMAFTCLAARLLFRVFDDTDTKFSDNINSFH